MIPNTKRHVFLVCLHLSVFALRASADIVLTVSPDSERLPVTGVPFLNDSVEEAFDDEGISLAPADAFGWTRTASDETKIRMILSIDSQQFDEGILTIWNWHNHPVLQRRFAAGSSHWFDVEIEGKGAYLFTLDSYRGGECKKRFVRSLAVTEDLNGAREHWRTDEFFLGICGFPGRYHWSFKGNPTLPPGFTEESARELEASLLARLGFQLIRPDESMEMGIRQVNGDAEYRFDFERMDAAVEAYTSRGFELALQLMHAPDWAIAEPYQNEIESIWRFPRKAVHQEAYLRALVRRYGQQARFFQIFNEPDQTAFWAGTTSEYVSQFRYSHALIRNLDEEKPIINGGYSLVEPEKTAQYIRELEGLSEWVAYHSHGDLADLIEDISEMRRLRHEAGLSPPKLVNTEMGYDGWRLDQERRKGQIVPQKVLHCWATGHVGVLLFGGRMTLGPEQVSQDFGFLDFQFCPRFVYGSLAGMVGVLEGASFEKTHAEGPNAYVYQFKAENRKIIAAFALEEDTFLRLKTNASQVVAIDEMGNRTAIQCQGELSAPLDGYPRYWEFVRDAEIELLESGK